MNRTEQNPEEMLDRIIGDIRNQQIDSAQVEESSRRVWDSIAQQKAGANRFAACGDFQTLIPAYSDGTLAPGRRMLLEDHVRGCASCRKRLFGEQQPAAKLVEMPAKKVARRRWMAIAASAAVALIAGQWAYDQFAPAPDGNRATVQLADGAVYYLHNGELRPVSAGTELTSREVLRTAAGSRALVKLFDGSTVEVGERAEFSVSAQRRDTTIHLNQGPIIVQAAKRSSGHLYVASGDSRVAVTGTIFSVNRGAKGTRVSVVEGEVVVQRNRTDSVLHSGDQLATHRSVENVAIQDEIAWSRNAADHVRMLHAMADIKKSLENVRMPGLRYASRLLGYVPANAVVFLSVPNARDSIADAQRMFTAEMKRAGAPVHDEKLAEFIDRLSKISEFLGEEVVVAGVRSEHGLNAVAIADVHRPGLAQFLEAERVKSNESKVQVVEGGAPVRSRQNEELLVAIRDNRVVIGVDDSLVNAAFSGGSGFAATPFGQRVESAFRDGAGILLGVDLHSIIPSAAESDSEKKVITKIGVDRVRYLIVEQKVFKGKAQYTANLSFDGERHGVASWLGTPGPMGGLAFVSPQAQFAASVITKNPQEMIDELFALAETKGPDGLAKLQEIQRLTGVDIKRDIAASLGSELTVALDGPMLPLPSWKVILEVNQPDRLQQAIEKLVAALNIELAKEGKGRVTITAANEESTEQRGIGPVVRTTRKSYTVQASGGTAFPALYYTYVDGYLVAASSKELLNSAVQGKASGQRLDTSDNFRRLLPTDQHASFSGFVYQNAQEALKLLATVSPQEQEKMRDIASQIGPTLIAAYADADRIQVTTFGSTMDMLMQTALAPAFHGGLENAAKKHGTHKQMAAYR